MCISAWRTAVRTIETQQIQSLKLCAHNVHMCTACPVRKQVNAHPAHNKTHRFAHPAHTRFENPLKFAFFGRTGMHKWGCASLCMNTNHTYAREATIQPNQLLKRCAAHMRSRGEAGRLRIDEFARACPSIACWRFLDLGAGTP